MRLDDQTVTNGASLRKPALALLLLAAVVGCEEAPKKNPFEPPKDAPIPAPPASAIKKPDVAPTWASRVPPMRIANRPTA